MTSMITGLKKGPVYVEVYEKITILIIDQLLQLSGSKRILFAIFKSSSIQHDVKFVNYGPIYSKIDSKAVHSML